MELFNKIVHNQGSTPPFFPPNPSSPAQKMRRALGRWPLMRVNKQGVSTANRSSRSDTSGPGCLKGGKRYPLDSAILVFLILNTCWAEIYLVDRNIQHLHSPSLDIICQWLPLFAALKQCPLSFTITGHCTLLEVNQGRSNTQCTPPPTTTKKKQVLSHNKITPLREGRWMIIIWG